MKSGRGGKRQGAGRKPGSGTGEGLPSHVIRVAADVSKEDCQAIPSVKAVLDHWRVECESNPSGARYHFLKQCLEDLEALGF